MDRCNLRGPVGDVRLGGGNDFLNVDALDNPFAPRSADGGPGSHFFSMDARCADLTVRVDDAATCDGATGGMVGFEAVSAMSELADATSYWWARVTPTTSVPAVRDVGPWTTSRPQGAASHGAVDVVLSHI